MESVCGGERVREEKAKEAVKGRGRVEKGEKKRVRGTYAPTPTHPCNSWDVSNYDGDIDLKIMNMNSNTFAHLQF